MNSPLQRRLAWGVICLALGCATAARAEEAASAIAAQDAPTILLTGYEPFGPGRPANPSWEGIKGLDGRRVGGYVIACRELKVEWGAPLAALNAWIDELRPAAVFSFGQGGADGFAIETRARNARGRIPDNLGNLPSAPTIAADGPDEFAATIDAEKLAAALAAAGYRMRVSKDAGQYLCEEALDTLELLKSRGRTAGEVLFCHVPPLGADAPDGRVTPEYVQNFVEKLLQAWAETHPARPTMKEAAAPVLRQTASAADEREKDVREFIDRYFRTWSAKDMERYGQCFMPQAAIQLIGPDGRLTTTPLRPFLESQREGHRKSKTGMTEAPESVDVRFEGRLARVVVFWKLVEGERVEYGYDHFTLMPSNGEWRIANLIFYATPEEEGP